MKLIVLIGAPGAGKGTQAALLESKLGYKQLSTGDVLRRHIKNGTEIGKKCADIIAAGKLVSDDILFEIIKYELPRAGDKVLLDGYPRTVRQAEDLATLSDNYPVNACIYLHVDTDELVARLSGRRLCKECGKTYHVKFGPPKTEDTCDTCNISLTQRPDDNPEQVAVRLDVYSKETKPVLDFYKSRGTYKEIDGMGSTQEIFDRLSAVIKLID